MRHKAVVYNQNSRPSGKLGSTRGYVKEDSPSIAATFYASLDSFDPEDPWLVSLIDLTDQRNTPTHVMECRFDKRSNKVKREQIVSIEDNFGVRYFDIVGRSRLNEREERLVLMLRLKKDGDRGGL